MTAGQTSALCTSPMTTSSQSCSFGNVLAVYFCTSVLVQGNSFSLSWAIQFFWCQNHQIDWGKASFSQGRQPSLGTCYSTSIPVERCRAQPSFFSS